MAAIPPMPLPTELQMNCRSALVFDWRCGGTARLLQRARYALTSNPVGAGVSIDNQTTPWIAGPYGLCAQLVDAAAEVDTGLDMDSVAEGTLAVYFAPQGAAVSNPVLGQDGAGFIIAFSVSNGNSLDLYRKWVTGDDAGSLTVTSGQWYLAVMDWGPRGTRWWVDGRLIGSNETVSANATNAGATLKLNKEWTTIGDNHLGFFGWWNLQMGGRVSRGLLRSRRALAA